MNGGRRVVYGAFRAEQAPRTTESVTQQSLLSGLGMALWDLAVNFTLEFALILTPVGVWTALVSRFSYPVADVVTAGSVAVVLSVGPSRRFVLRQLRNSRLHRKWQKAARFAGLATQNDHIPMITKITETPVGQRLRIRVPSGSAPSYVEGASERLATCLEVREVKLTPDVNNARFATIDIVRRDPLADSDPTPWPHLNAERLSIWDPIPIGMNEFGEIGFVTLPERNVLLGGEPGAGKSVALSQLVATAALDPSCDLTLLDGKQVELAAWAKSARSIVGPSISDACDVLRTVQSEMNERYGVLLANGQRKIQQYDGNRLHVVVCDELAFYLTMGERKENQEFERLARDLVARGRAAGVIFLAATQRPSHDIVPTSLRDLFAFRWALRCTTPQASDTILGQGWASQGFSTHTIDAACRGVGYLRHEGAEPQRLRSFCLTDDDIDTLGHRAAILRHPPQALEEAS